MIKLPSYIQLAFDKIKENNGLVYLVGGCVRDHIIGNDIKDYDLTTNLKPEKISEIFSGFKQVNNNGITHGTVSIIIENQLVEITSFRKDVDCDGRHSKIEYTTSLKEDLKRRDFTINAIAYADGVYYDYFNGIEDIKNKVIKSVGDSKKRFKEDYLRILRALRFSSVLSFKIDKETVLGIYSELTGLKKISSERITVELTKILLGENVKEVLLLYKEVFALLIPELAKTFNFNQKSIYHSHDIYTHIVNVVANSTKDVETRYAALLHDVGKPDVFSVSVKNNKEIGYFYNHEVLSATMSEKILERFSLKTQFNKNIVKLIRYHGIILNEKKSLIIKQLNNYDNNFELFRKLIALKIADSSDHLINSNTNYDEILNILNKIEINNECISLKGLKINGTDLLNLGLRGTVIGSILDEILKLVINGKLENDYKIIIDYVKKRHLNHM